VPRCAALAPDAWRGDGLLGLAAPCLTGPKARRTAVGRMSPEGEFRAWVFGYLLVSGSTVGSSSSSEDVAEAVMEPSTAVEESH
jgi:hypothetical protein